MNNFKFKTETINTVDYNVLQWEIEKFYHISEYCIPAVEEVGNDSSIRIEVQKGPFDEWDQKTINSIRQGKHESFSLRTVMQDLANNDVISEGIWLIKISW